MTVLAAQVALPECSPSVNSAHQHAFWSSLPIFLFFFHLCTPLSLSLSLSLSRSRSPLCLQTKKESGLVVRVFISGWRWTRFEENEEESHHKSCGSWGREGTWGNGQPLDDASRRYTCRICCTGQDKTAPYFNTKRTGHRAGTVRLQMFVILLLPGVATGVHQKQKLQSLWFLLLLRAFFFSS